MSLGARKPKGLNRRVYTGGSKPESLNRRVHTGGSKPEGLNRRVYTGGSKQKGQNKLKTPILKNDNLLLTRSLVLCVCFVYRRCRFVLFLLAIVLSVLLRCTNSGYPFGVFGLLFLQYMIRRWKHGKWNTNILFEIDLV
jgi:hypothetical protein